MPVIAAFKLQNPLAPRRRPSYADRGHRRLRSGADKSQALNGRKKSHDQLRQVSFGFSGSAEACRVARCSLNRLYYRRKSMAENHRPPRPEVVDVSVSIRVKEICALCSCHKRRLSAHRTEPSDRRVHPSRKELLRTTLQCPRLRLVHDHLRITLSSV